MRALYNRWYGGGGIPGRPPARRRALAGVCGRSGGGGLLWLLPPRGQSHQVIGPQQRRKPDCTTNTRPSSTFLGRGTPRPRHGHNVSPKKRGPQLTRVGGCAVLSRGPAGQVQLSGPQVRRQERQHAHRQWDVAGLGRAGRAWHSDPHSAPRTACTTTWRSAGREPASWGAGRARGV